MVGKWFEAIAPEVVDDLFGDMLAEASEEENISILFNILQNCLGMAARGCESGHGVMQQNGVVGAVAACALTFALGRNGTVALVLAGAAVSSLTAAGIALALNFAPSPYAAYEIMTWLLGSLADKSWTQVMLVAPFAAIGCVLLAMTGRALDALSLGEAQAQSLGVNLTRLAAMVVAGTAFSVGAITAVSGAIGFIGLVAPHLVRPFVGYAPRRVLLPATLAGALLLLCADIAARLVHTNPELRLGVFTSLLGTPFFFWLVVRIRKVAP